MSVFYTSNYNKDSVDRFVNIFSQKKYIALNGDGTRGIVVYDSIQKNIQISFFLRDMNVANQKDFVNMIGNYHLNKDKTSRTSVLNVPVGQEEIWVNRLKNKSFYTFSERVVMFKIY